MSTPSRDHLFDPDNKIARFIRRPIVAMIVIAMTISIAFHQLEQYTDHKIESQQVVFCHEVERIQSSTQDRIDSYNELRKHVAPLVKDKDLRRYLEKELDNADKPGIKGC